MSKKLFVLLIILMSLSLVGIIFVQGIWIKTSVDDKEEQFSMNVNQALKTVSNRLQERDMAQFIDVILNNSDSITPSEKEISKLFIAGVDSKTNEKFVYSQGILEEDYGVSSSFFDNMLDTISVKRLISVRTTITEPSGTLIDNNMPQPEKRITKIGQLSKIDKALYETSYNDIASKLPLTSRTSKKEVELLLKKEFNDRKIDTKFEYGIYSNGLATKIRSKNFDLLESNLYESPLFINNDGVNGYNLMVSFPEKKTFLISSIISMVFLSLIFTLVIIVAYSSAIMQLMRQRQISEIKTDFINNMTHEFKTPIATINLALDAIKSPRIISDVDKVKHYVNVIREENKRMHAQVENVLRISKLEKNQLNINKERTNIHEVIEDAITHVQLIVDDRGGYIETHFEADREEVLANDIHFTNVIVNILDNAIKYSDEAPQIDVYTQVVKNNIVIEIKDQGAGMTKAVLKRIFEKFYREHTGDIHNVKGHGLGLAYVKKIVEDHQGEVYAESEKGKGTSFYIKLPLI